MTWSIEDLQKTVEEHLDKIPFGRYLGTLRPVFVKERSLEQLCALCAEIEEVCQIELSNSK